MPDDEPPQPTLPFFLIVADYDRGLFSVEGPMTDDGPWNLAAGRGRENNRHVHCGPTGTDRDEWTPSPLRPRDCRRRSLFRLPAYGGVPCPVGSSTNGVTSR
jgi:hypothetical protein